MEDFLETDMPLFEKERGGGAVILTRSDKGRPLSSETSLAAGEHLIGRAPKTAGPLTDDAPLDSSGLLGDDRQPGGHGPGGWPGKRFNSKEMGGN